MSAKTLMSLVMIVVRYPSYQAFLATAERRRRTSGYPPAQTASMY
jgi:hypothetical protein